MNFDINHIIRSAALVLVGAPLALSTSNLINTTSTVAVQSTERTGAEQVKLEYNEKLSKACFAWALSKVDSKLEREAKNEIDEVFGGEVDYKKTCNAFVF